jgi:hypothetical protein
LIKKETTTMAAKSRKITLKEAFQKGFLMGCAYASHSNIRPETLVDDAWDELMEELAKDEETQAAQAGK